MDENADTIFALATAHGRAGVAVVRVSGSKAFAAVRKLAGDEPAPRRATLRKLKRAVDGQVLDHALVLTFPAPHSFTGEDVAEFHIHGGAAVAAAVLDALSREEGLRAADAGEFTRRAFENEKLDLTEVEGLADLIDAETEGQRVQALRQMDGALSRLYEGWRGDLIGLMAQIEAEIDFPDEGDVTTDSGVVLQLKIETLRNTLATHLNESKRGERLRDGVRCAIIGAPNAGKSSLLNRLARREAAIVSDIPGTTRDVVEVRLVLAGAPVWVADTAGLREAAEAIEAEGIRRALARAAESDIRIGLIDGSLALPLEAHLPPLQDGDLLVVTRADRPHTGLMEAAESWAKVAKVACINASLTHGEGVSEIETWLTKTVSNLTALGEAPALSRARHRHHVESAIESLKRAEAAMGLGLELAGEDLRIAARDLGRITGRVDVEDILDKVFSDFCIGK